MHQLNANGAFQSYLEIGKITFSTGNVGATTTSCFNMAAPDVTSDVYDITTLFILSFFVFIDAMAGSEFLFSWDSFGNNSWSIAVNYLKLQLATLNKN